MILGDDTAEYRLGPYVQILEDVSKKLDIDDVSSPEFSDQFITNQSPSINQGITDSPYWFRFSLTGTEKKTPEKQVGGKPGRTEWLLYLGKHLDFYDEIKVFWKKLPGEKTAGSDDAKWQVTNFGMNQAVKTGERDPLAIRLSLPDNIDQSLTVYMRIEMVGGLFLDPVLYSPDAYNLFSKKLSVFYGAYYGLLLSMLVYNLFHFLFLRDKVRLIFIVYATTICAYFLIANELSMAIFPASFLPASRKAAHLLALMTMAQIAYFTMVFLEANKIIPLVYRLLQIIVLAAGVLIFALPFFSYLSMGKVTSNFGMIISFIIMTAGLNAWLRGYQPARFFILAWVFFLGGGVVYALNFTGIFPYAFIGNNAAQAGSGLEMLLLSLAIADRMKYLFEKLSQAQSRRRKQISSLTHKLVQTEEHERRRIAVVLHDSIGQTLAVTKWRIEHLLKTWDPSCSLDTRVLSDLESCINETRNLTAELCPRVLYELGLAEALKSLAESFTKKYGLTVKIKTEKKPDIVSQDLRFLLYRAVSELLINVVKHANAGYAQIILTTKNKYITVSVQDDGVGFDYNAEPNPGIKGFGLFSIQERINHIEGSFKVERIPPKGVKVAISIPVTDS